jgi:hypothetical protein
LLGTADSYPAETEYLSHNFMECAQIDKYRQNNLLSCGDLLFLKTYESDIFDHHLHSIMSTIVEKYPVGSTVSSYSDIDANLSNDAKTNIVWFSQNVAETLFTVNDFPFVYIDNDDIRELIINDDYVIRSMVNYGNINDALSDIKLLYYKQFDPQKY